MKYGLGVVTWSPLAGGWLSGAFRKDAEQIVRPARSTAEPWRYDPTLPQNAAKFSAADSLATLAREHDLALIHLALAFVAQHPAVTAPIIGPRTMAQLESYLGATEVALSTEILDAIDRIVPPGVTLTTRDAGYTPSSLRRAELRRRA